MVPDEATSAGERLLRGDAAARAAEAVEAQVEAQVNAALHGPLAGGLASGRVASQRPQPDPTARPQSQEALAAAEAALMLGTEVPRRFIAAGAALAAALAAVTDGDEVQAAGGLLCAQRRLFPEDPAAAAALSAAVAPAVDRVLDDLGGQAAAGPIPAPEAMHRRVVAAADELERAYLASRSHVARAALAARSWLPITGGLGDATALRGRYGPFLDGLVRWAFYVEAALAAVRRDHWSLVGAALLAAHQQVQLGAGDFNVIAPPVS